MKTEDVKSSRNGGA